MGPVVYTDPDRQLMNANMMNGVTAKDLRRRARYMNKLSLSILCVNLVLIGCSEDSVQYPEFAVRDSAGTIIADNVIPDSPNQCRLQEMPEVSIGAIGGAPEYQLHRVFAATLLSDGSIAVPNQGTDDVRIYRPNGEFSYAFGRAGNGPGEFRSLLAIWATVGDTLILGDIRPWRLSYFTSDGEFLRAAEAQPVIIGAPTQVGRFGDGTFLFASTCCHHAAAAYTEETVTAIRYNATGQLLDTLGTYPYGSRGHSGPERQQRITSPVFEWRTRIAASGDGLVVGLENVPQYVVMGFNGETRRIVRWNAELKDVRDADIRAYRERERAVASDEDALEYLPALIDPNRPVREHLPIFTGMLVSRNEDVWIRRFSHPSEPLQSVWLLFDQQGAFRCELALPQTARPHDILETGPDYVLLKEVDDMGVERIRLRRFIDSSGE